MENYKTSKVGMETARKYADIIDIFEMREQVAEMAGKNYGNLKAYRK